MYFIRYDPAVEWWYGPFPYHLLSLLSTQVIQTVSAVDKDDPIQGHYFDYRLVPEMLNNPNFTIKNNPGG